MHKFSKSDWFNRTLNDQAFIGGAQQLGITAEYAGVGIYNPAASTKWLYVHRVSSHVKSAQEKSHRLYHKVGNLANQDYEYTKMLDGALATAQADVLKESLANLANFGNRMTADVLCANTINWLDGSEGIVIAPGHMLIVACSDAESALRVLFEWVEKLNPVV